MLVWARHTEMCSFSRHSNPILPTEKLYSGFDPGVNTYLSKYLPLSDFAYLWHTWIYLSLPTIDHMIQKELFYLSVSET